MGKFSAQFFNFILGKVRSKVILVKFSSEDEGYINDGKNFAKTFDFDDYPYIALALKPSLPIWTNNKEMIKHGLLSGKYSAINTQALKGKSLEEIKEDLKKKLAR